MRRQTLVWGMLISALGTAGAHAQAEDGVLLTVRMGANPGEVVLAWSGPGTAFDIYRDTVPVIAADAPHRLGTTGSLQWTDTPPDAQVQFYTVTSSTINRLAVEALEPYVFLAADSSGSMSTVTGSGPPGCPGSVDTRLDHVRCAINTLARDHAEVVLGLGRFRLTTIDTNCSDGCTLTGLTCTGCDPVTGAGCTSAMASDARLEVLAPLLAQGLGTVMRWTDFACGTCGTEIASNPEFYAAGPGPIGGALKGVRRYWQGLQATDGTLLWPGMEPGYDPIRGDSLAGAFLPTGAQCRPYLVVALVDGVESCASLVEAPAAAAALLATDVDGSTYRIETRAVAIGMAPGDAQIEALVHAGGAPDIAGANEGYYPRDADEMGQALAQIIAGAVRSERCNDTDDDCDQIVDEDFPGKGQFCDDGTLGACRGTGYRVCRPDGGATVCHVTTPGLSPSPETCNLVDDDCDGAVDDGCGSCVDTEFCGDGIDNDCDGTIDDGCVACVNWVDVGGGVEIMQYEASRPDATPGSVGDIASAVCSRPGAQPWTNVTASDAGAACATAGARLCTEQEWQRACAVVAPTTYPAVEPAGNNGAILIEAENFLANTPASTPDGVIRAFVPDYTSGYSGFSALRASPDTGAAVAAADAPSQSPRLDFAIAVTVAGNHYVWVRLFAPNGAGDMIHVGVSTTPAASAPTVTITAIASGSWVWMRSGPFNLTTGTKTASLYVRDDGIKVDVIYVTRSNGTTAPTVSLNSDGGHWAYATTPDMYNAGTCNGRDLDTDGGTAGDQDEVFAAGGVPGAQCYAAHAGGRKVFDLSGNVKEWTAPRTPGLSPIHGGASNSEAEGISCVAAGVAGDGYAAPNIGFRCCR